MKNNEVITNNYVSVSKLEEKNNKNHIVENHI